ncbi:MurR/RpiR family transcriptional regulator [Actinotalea sp. M2MS4P-6]|uniref:MurR/RpiR family transcriptional regulator n=1 Tax=Actinotalea sp. M2MS4P-6 TaxID=2983762 RepID=UPI0021E4191A|nr:MurR/RpiR family transcriptional regulator [Actinotalea sp. M2MS4P-6]MCV2394370.1 MurR/RpiR family transcriptional regulator [Actinotalea sp. M2MS4P-6]
MSPEEIAASDDPQVRARRQFLFELAAGRQLTATQRRVMNCLIANAQDAPYLTINDLADLAHVSQPSVTRFANAVGFEGYPQFRDAIRRALPSDDERTAELTNLNMWQRSVTYEMAAMEELRRQMADPAPLRAAAEVLAASRPLSVLGLRSAGPAAQYFGYFASKALPDVRALTSVGTVAMVDALMHAHTAGGSALLAFLLPRYPKETIKLLEIARGFGMTVVCITDTPTSPATRYADHVLYAPVESSLSFDSHAVPLALSLMLLEAICAVDEVATQKRLEEYERYVASLDLFV